MVSQNQIKTCVQDTEKKNEWRRENKKGNRFSIFENDRFSIFDQTIVFPYLKTIILKTIVLWNDRFETDSFVFSS